MLNSRRAPVIRYSSLGGRKEISLLLGGCSHRVTYCEAPAPPRRDSVNTTSRGEVFNYLNP